VLRTLGKKAALFVLTLDMLKGVASVIFVAEALAPRITFRRSLKSTDTSSKFLKFVRRSVRMRKISHPGPRSDRQV